jgi:hypothetical protein
MLLISRDSKHLRRLCGDPKAPATSALTAGSAKSRLSFGRQAPHAPDERLVIKDRLFGAVGQHLNNARVVA